MSQIVVPQIQMPNMVQSVATMNPNPYQDAFKTLNDTLSGVKTAIRDSNMASLVDYVNKAQSMKDFNNADFQQGLSDLKAGFANEIDPRAYANYMQKIPDQLNQRESDGLRLQDQRNTFEDQSVQSKIYRQLVKNPNADVSALLGTLHNAAPVVQGIDNLRNSDVTRRSTLGNLQLNIQAGQRQQQELNLKQQEFNNRKAFMEQYGAALFGTDTGAGAGTPTATTGGGVAYTPIGSSKSPYASMISNAAKGAGINPDLAWAVANTESGLNPNATSKAGAGGIMQLMPNTFKGVNKGQGSLYDPQANISAGVSVLSQLSKQYSGNVPMILAGYNAGPGRLQQARTAAAKAGRPNDWLQFLPSETRNYVSKVTTLLAKAGNNSAPQSKAVGTVPPMIAAQGNGVQNAVTSKQQAKAAALLDSQDAEYQQLTDKENAVTAINAYNNASVFRSLGKDEARSLDQWSYSKRIGFGHNNMYLVNTNPQAVADAVKNNPGVKTLGLTPTEQARMADDIYNQLQSTNRFGGSASDAANLTAQYVTNLIDTKQAAMAAKLHQSTTKKVLEANKINYDAQSALQQARLNFIRSQAGF